MRKKNPKIFLEDIFESIERIEGYTKGKTLENFLEDYEKQDAIIKRLEIIGEAVKIFPLVLRGNILKFHGKT